MFWTNSTELLSFFSLQAEKTRWIKLTPISLSLEANNFVTWIYVYLIPRFVAYRRMWHRGRGLYPQCRDVRIYLRGCSHLCSWSTNAIQFGFVPRKISIEYIKYVKLSPIIFRWLGISLSKSSKKLSHVMAMHDSLQISCQKHLTCGRRSKKNKRNSTICKVKCLFTPSELGA